MTLDDLERQNRGFYGFFGYFRLRHKIIHKATPLYYRNAIQMEKFGICILTQREAEPL